MRDLARILFIVILLLCLWQAIYYYPLLPDRVASHFGISGRPDAWTTKDFFVKFYLAMVGFVAILFPGIVFLLRRISPSMINLPNRDYWLSPEHRDETMDVLVRRFLWFGSATLLLLLDMFHQTFRVHLGMARGLDHPVMSIAAYMGFSLLWSIGLFVRFMRRP